MISRLDTRCVQGCQEIGTLHVAVQSQFFQESGQPGETFFLCDRASRGSAWTMQEFLDGTLEFGMCQVGCSRVLVCLHW